MTDDLGDRLKRLDGARALPPELRARLERTLLADDALGAAVAASDAARPVPAELRSGLETAMLSGAAAEGMPTGVRRRLQRRLAAPRRDRWQSITAVAAAVILVAGLAAALTAGGGPRRTARGLAAGPRTSKATTGAGAAGIGDLGSTTSAPVAGGGGGGTGAAATAGALSASAAGREGSGPPPPFVYGYDAATAMIGDNSPYVVPQRSTLRVARITGDGDAEKGFQAYIDLLNRSGGAGGHHLDIVTTAPSLPVKNVVATANLGLDPVVTSSGPPSWAATPLLETLTVPEAALAGDVFSMASVLERQAHLAVDGAFPNPAPGQRAVIYVPAQGLFADRVAPAFEEALRAKQVVSVRQIVDPSAQPVFVSADAAFVSLPAADTTRWVRAAHDAGYQPGQLWGVATMFNEALANLLPPHTTVASPYQLLTGDEADALRRGTGQTALNGRLVHGWVTAKWLAYAIWAQNADTAAKVAAALAGSTSFNSGWAPPYEVRPQTHSRTPEAADLHPSGATFTSGAFRTDRF